MVKKILRMEGKWQHTAPARPRARGLRPMRMGTCRIPSLLPEVNFILRTETWKAQVLFFGVQLHSSLNVQRRQCHTAGAGGQWPTTPPRPKWVNHGERRDQVSEICSPGGLLIREEGLVIYIRAMSLPRRPDTSSVTCFLGEMEVSVKLPGNRMKCLPALFLSTSNCLVLATQTS